jgi:hypothetical protein
MIMHNIWVVLPPKLVCTCFLSLRHVCSSYLVMLGLAEKVDFTRKTLPLCPGMASIILMVIEP